MTLIALVHAAWLSLLPIGVIVAASQEPRPRTRAVAVGALLVALSLPAVAFCKQMWPFDFLLPRAETRLVATTQAFEVTLVQRPGEDFYDSFFEVRRRSDGEKTRVMHDPDDDKWWRPRLVVRGTRRYFVRGAEAVTPQTPFVDAADETLFSGLFDESYALQSLNFDAPWN